MANNDAAADERRARELSINALQRAYIDTKSIDLEFEGGTVRLAGRVSSRAQRELAEEVVRVACAPRAVDNELHVASAPPPSIATDVA